MAEFDEYAGNYQKLVGDPVRDWFGPGDHFFFVRKWELLAKHLRSLGMRPESLSWLDIGCGRGDLLRIGAPCFQRAVGCDVSEGMLADAAGLEVFPQPSPTELPFSDRSFDLATAVCVYHHVVPELRLGLTREMARILRPGGVACIIEHNPLNPVTQMIVRRLPVDRDAQLLTWSTAGTLLRASGLEGIQTKQFLFMPEAVYKRAGKIEKWLEWLPLGGQYATFGRRVHS